MSGGVGDISDDRPDYARLPQLLQRMAEGKHTRVKLSTEVLLSAKMGARRQRECPFPQLLVDPLRRREVRKCCAVEPAAQSLLKAAVTQLHLSASAFHRTLKLA